MSEKMPVVLEKYELCEHNFGLYYRAVVDLEGLRYDVEIALDTDAPSPRTAWDNMGAIAVVKSSRYLLDEKQESVPVYDQRGVEEFQDDLSQREAEWLPIYSYEDCSCTILYTAPSGRAVLTGWIYVDREQIIAEYGDDGPESRQLAQRVLRGEVEALNTWLRGDVWGYTYTVSRPDTCDCCGHTRYSVETSDSCWGFYGLDYVVEELNRLLSALDVIVEID